jgi:N-acetylornithine carbamoyltransferase
VNGLQRLADLDPEEVARLAERALALRNGAAPDRHPGRALGLLFLAPSLRTHASFQRAAGRLGLDLVDLQAASTWGLELRDDVVMDGGAAEHVREAAAVLGRYVDVLAVRVFAGFEDLAADRADLAFRAFAEHAGVPVVSMESAWWHPCQALADRVTLDQLAVPRRATLALTWAWHPKALPHAVASSTLCMATQRGMDVLLCHPEGFELHPSVVDDAARLAAENGGELRISHDPGDVRAADVVYAKSWAGLDAWSDPEAEAARRAELRPWCVTPDRLAHGAHFMHCLPIRRNVVATDAVLDGPASVVLEQAENRLHAQTAVLEHLLAGPRPTTSESLPHAEATP